MPLRLVTARRYGLPKLTNFANLSNYGRRLLNNAGRERFVKTMKSADVPHASSFSHGVVLVPNSGIINAARRNFGCHLSCLPGLIFATGNKSMAVAQRERTVAVDRIS